MTFSCAQAKHSVGWWYATRWQTWVKGQACKQSCCLSTQRQRGRLHLGSAGSCVYSPWEVEVTKSKPYSANSGNPAAQGRTVVPLLTPQGSYGLRVSVVEILRVTALNTVFKYKYMKTMCWWQSGALHAIRSCLSRGKQSSLFCIKSVLKKKKDSPENNLLKDLYQIKVNTFCDRNWFVHVGSFLFLLLRLNTCWHFCIFSSMQEKILKERSSSWSRKIKSMWKRI